MIFLLILALACALDAASTVALIGRGGHEVLSAWMIGAQPKPLPVWLLIFALPVALGALILCVAPVLHWVLLLLAAWRAGMAWRNHRLQRA